MKLCCEAVADLLPSLRALVAGELMNEYKLSQKEIAKRLFITQPAVSQYLRNLRGGDKRLLENSVQEIKSLCERLHSNDINEEALLKEFYNICNAAVGNNGHTHDPENIIVQ